MHPKVTFPGHGREGSRAAKNGLRRTSGVALGLALLGVWLSLPAVAVLGPPAPAAALSHPQRMSTHAVPIISPQVVRADDRLLDQPVAPQPEAVPPALNLSVSLAPEPGRGSGMRAVDGTEPEPPPGRVTRLADTGFHGVWLLPLAAGLIVLGVLFAVFASRKQRHDEELLVAEQAQLEREAAEAEIAHRTALSELEEEDEREDDDAARDAGAGDIGFGLGALGSRANGDTDPDDGPDFDTLVHPEGDETHGGPVGSPGDAEGTGPSAAGNGKRPDAQ